MRKVLICLLLCSCGADWSPCPPPAAVVDFGADGWHCALSDGTMHGPFDQRADDGGWCVGYMNNGSPCGRLEFSSGEVVDHAPCPF